MAVPQPQEHAAGDPTNRPPNKLRTALTGSKKPSPFVSKLFEMLEEPRDQKTRELIKWTSDGTEFTVKDPPSFSHHVLPNYFKHSNWQSFIRQLNIYGYRKTSDSSHDSQSQHRTHTCDFCHPDFQRGRPEPLRLIRRVGATDVREELARQNRERTLASTEPLTAELSLASATAALASAAASSGAAPLESRPPSPAPSDDSEGSVSLFASSRGASPSSEPPSPLLGSTTPPLPEADSGSELRMVWATLTELQSQMHFNSLYTSRALLEINETLGETISALAADQQRFRPEWHTAQRRRLEQAQRAIASLVQVHYARTNTRGGPYDVLRANNPVLGRPHSFSTGGSVSLDSEPTFTPLGLMDHHHGGSASISPPSISPSSATTPSDPFSVGSCDTLLTAAPSPEVGPPVFAVNSSHPVGSDLDSLAFSTFARQLERDAGSGLAPDSPSKVPSSFPEAAEDAPAPVPLVSNPLVNAFATHGRSRRSHVPRAKSASTTPAPPQQHQRLGSAATTTSVASSLGMAPHSIAEFAKVADDDEYSSSDEETGAGDEVGAGAEGANGYAALNMPAMIAGRSRPPPLIDPRAPKRARTLA